MAVTMGRMRRGVQLYWRLLGAGLRLADRAEIARGCLRAAGAWMKTQRGGLHVRRWVTIRSDGILYATPPLDNSFTNQEADPRHSVVVPEVIRQVGALEGGLYVDVGANLGYVTMAVARRFPERRVIAIEPIPSLAEALKRTARLNGFDNVIVVPQAVGASNRIELRVPVRGGVRFSSLASSDGAGIPKIPNACLERISVPAIELDDLLRILRVRASAVACLKVDVEGAEMEVLETAVSLLRHGPAVVFEALDEEHRSDIQALLETHGYASIRKLDHTNFVATRGR